MFSKIVLEHLSPMQFSAATSFIAVITCLIILQIQKKAQKDYQQNEWTRAKGIRLIALSCTTFFAIYLTNLAISEVGPLTAIERQRVRSLGGLEWLSAGPRIAIFLHRIVTVLSEFR